MKSIFLIVVVLFLSTTLTSCSKDDDSVSTPVLVSAELFEDTSIMETSPTVEFRINFDKAASATGYIILGVTSTNEAAFTSNPPVTNGEIEIPVQKGKNFATLEFSPQNNELLQNNGVVTLVFKDSSEDIIFGNKRSTTIAITDDEEPVSASFNSAALGVTENDPEGVEVRIIFSAPAPGEGSVSIQLQGNEDNYFVSTYPALNDQQKILVPVEAGTVFTTFQVYPKDNALLENHKILKLNISGTNGVVIKGALAELDLHLLDDEIQGKIKSVETVGSNGKRSKKTWEYATDGKVSKVLWEQEPANVTNGTDNYYYSNSGLIESVGTFPGEGENFVWQNGRVVVVENISGFFKVAYSTLDYNEDGRIGKKTFFQIKADGTFTAEKRYDYEYFSDGNLKTESIYVKNSNNVWVLDSSLGYDSYTEKVNPAPFEIIHTHKVQQYLPLYYTIKGEGVNFSSYYIYDFNAEGMVIKKRSTTETTTYSYY